MTNKKIFTLLALLSVLIFTTLKAQTPVTGITVEAVSATPSSYTVHTSPTDSTTYNWGQGDDLFLRGVETSLHSYSIDNALQRDITFIRVDNGLVSGERCRVFTERINDTNFEPTYPTDDLGECSICLLYTSPSPRDLSTSRMPSSA